MYCAKCGKEMDDSAKFCPVCGADANGDSATVQADSTPYSAPSSIAAEEQQSSGSGVGAMVCGIIGLVLCWVPIVGLILSIVAIVLGSKGRKELAPDKRGMATAGFVMGIIALIISIIVLIVWIVTIAIIGSIASFALGGLL